MIQYIDREPPEMTGNAQEDIASLFSYMGYLREQLNFIISTIKKNV